MNTKNADTLSPEEAKEQEIAALRARLAELEAQSESKFLIDKTVSAFIFQFIQTYYYPN